MGRQSFLGKGWAFPIRVGPGGGIATASDEEAIAQAIGLILRTSPGERVMLPDYGCGLADLAFAPLNHQTLSRTGRQIEAALRDWEPRIDVDGVLVETDPADESRLLISVSYRVRATNARGNRVYPFYLTEGGGV
ncbi:MAG TPA: GPW/gp25 family protein [Symbiobacteriaceae bacterium]|jgi:phage baseplate assembly protein W|nr:GPW/gp25 family protein [Symbiobacteriaceae bacterium]